MEDPVRSNVAPDLINHIIMVTVTRTAKTAMTIAFLMVSNFCVLILTYDANILRKKFS